MRFKSLPASALAMMLLAGTPGLAFAQNAGTTTTGTVTAPATATVPATGVATNNGGGGGGWWGLIGLFGLFGLAGRRARRVAPTDTVGVRDNRL